MCHPVAYRSQSENNIRSISPPSGENHLLSNLRAEKNTRLITDCQEKKCLKIIE